MPLGGFSFQPGSQDTQFPQRGQGGQGSAPQQAIRTLSLRVPQQSGPQGIAPLPLLNASGGGGGDLDMLLMALLKAFGQGGAVQGFSGRRPQGANATPRIIPGIDDPTGGGQPGPQQIPRTIPNDFPVPGNPSPQPLPPPEFSQGDFMNRVPGGGIGNTGRPRGMVEPLF